PTVPPDVPTPPEAAPPPPAAAAAQGEAPGRYWVYDSNHKLLGTFDDLAAAEQRGMKFGVAMGETAHIVDSTGKQEKSLTVFEPGFNREPEWMGWRPDPFAEVEAGAAEV